MVSWCSRKQTFVALTTTEAEYIALSMSVCEAVWFRKLLTDLFECVLDSTIIHYGNQSCVKISDNPFFHDKLNHIEIKYQYFLPLHHVSDVMVLDLNVVQFVMKHWIIRDLHTTLVTIMNNGGIQHMFG